MKKTTFEIQFSRAYSWIIAAIGSVLLLPVFTACTGSAQPAPEDKQIVNLERWYVPAQEVARCGARIRAEEVLVVDLDALDYDAETLERQIGPFRQTTDKPVAVSGEGTSEAVEQRVRKTAAGLGCDIVLLGPVHKEMDYPGDLGMRPGGAKGKKEVSYQLFRMGYRTD